VSSGAEGNGAFVEEELKRDLARLEQLLGDTRVRFRRGETPRASLEKLIDVDLEIRNALKSPLSAELQLEARRLTARLLALDPR